MAGHPQDRRVRYNPFPNNIALSSQLKDRQNASTKSITLLCKSRVFGKQEQLLFYRCQKEVNKEKDIIIKFVAVRQPYVKAINQQTRRKPPDRSLLSSVVSRVFLFVACMFPPPRTAHVYLHCGPILFLCSRLDFGSLVRPYCAHICNCSHWSIFPDMAGSSITGYNHAFKSFPGPQPNSNQPLTADQHTRTKSFTLSCLFLPLGFHDIRYWSEMGIKMQKKEQNRRISLVCM
ncbi:hypothetical protein B0H66DRAFT_331516 [Apodospora peruviana]|uniref:Uncharacterized protein n=1 Tax=Apodospora peruviana TaxID=516989 RepID=A0AAE0M0X4_9PEZI|nr:hypothetical protein B0H66DRAFT_331516 [Apodospora peruviana]